MRQADRPLLRRYKAPRVRTTVVTPGHIRTPLFADVKTSALAAFLSPTLEPQAVAQAMVDALERQESSHIAMPFYAHSAPLLKTLPSFLRDLAQWVSQASGRAAACAESHRSQTRTTPSAPAPRRDRNAWHDVGQGLYGAGYDV